jgi:molybdate transport system substrate-binding protein
MRVSFPCLLFVLLSAVVSARAGAADLVVSAASSLTNAFNDIARGYEAQHAGTKVLLNYGASGALLQQIAKGAPVDVFASADQETMDQAVARNLVLPADRRNFVQNALVVVVPMDARVRVTRLSDLASAPVARIAIGMPASVPVGRYTKHALEAAKLWPAIEPKAIYTQNVRQSLDYVARGEVDAGFVYGTDAVVVKDKVRVAFSVPLDLPIAYPIARTRVGANAAEAQRFVDYVLSPAGQAILGKYGFLKP